ncbi:MAG: peptidyl-prolyl cis-trans isomerase [Rubripirellula sp.]|nr:peptidyl-prolyl cis-trans isomerase [Rubripirellula sp.]
MTERLKKLPIAYAGRLASVNARTQQAHSDLCQMLGGGYKRRTKWFTENVMNTKSRLSLMLLHRSTPHWHALVFAMACLNIGFSTLVAVAQVPTVTEVEATQAIDLPEDPAAIVAVVGKTPILLGDLMPKVEARIKEVTEKSGQTIPAEQLHYARVNLIRGMLSQAIQNKMMRESFLLDQVGTQAADKRAEAEEMLSSRARQMFFESEVPELKKQYKVNDLTKLDTLLREKGSSLAARQRDFIDAMLGHLYIRSKVERDPDVSIAEINNYYQGNSDDFARPYRARWEQLSVLFANFPSREAAHQVIWEMGREAYFGGSMESVAREKSQEPFGKQGGVHDWTAQGSLASDPLDQEIFRLPLDAMSEIIEDSSGYHIVRVIERQEPGFTPLSEVQDEIRGKIRQQKINDAQRKVMEDLAMRIPVWTMFPKDLPESKPLPPSIARRQTSKLR